MAKISQTVYLPQGFHVTPVTSLKSTHAQRCSNKSGLWCWERTWTWEGQTKVFCFFFFWNHRRYGVTQNFSSSELAGVLDYGERTWGTGMSERLSTRTVWIPDHWIQSNSENCSCTLKCNHLFLSSWTCPIIWKIKYPSCWLPKNVSKQLIAPHFCGGFTRSIIPELQLKQDRVSFPEKHHKLKHK